MDKKLAEKLAKRLQSMGRLDEYTFAIDAIEFVNLGIPEMIIGQTTYSKIITAGEYMTTRALWDLINE